MLQFLSPVITEMTCRQLRNNFFFLFSWEPFEFFKPGDTSRGLQALSDQCLKNQGELLEETPTRSHCAMKSCYKKIFVPTIILGRVVSAGLSPHPAEYFFCFALDIASSKKEEAKNKPIPRTRNFLLRRQAPYPLGHTGFSWSTTFFFNFWSSVGIFFFVVQVFRWFRSRVISQAICPQLGPLRS